MSPSLSPTGSQSQIPTNPSVPSSHLDPSNTLAVTTIPRSDPSCGPWGRVHVLPVPTSRSGALGDPLTLECRFWAPPAANVTWLQVCPQRYHGDTWNCSWPQEVQARAGGLQVVRREGLSTLNFRHLEHNHSGLYFCRVEFGNATAQSCGTFVRVREPVHVPFLDLREATKNRILTDAGVLLLLCKAVLGGPFTPKPLSPLQFSFLQGLNLDECSMYEDISRGIQPTYQDVGTPPAADGLMEKP
uniref:Ig-like domain-containing protein n=1 Tax=Malurus cyaneus samueli TaxID=2593467 RepID=A0A8C5U3N1_9PASS